MLWVKPEVFIMLLLMVAAVDVAVDYAVSVTVGVADVDAVITM